MKRKKQQPYWEGTKYKKAVRICEEDLAFLWANKGTGRKARVSNFLHKIIQDWKKFNGVD